MRVVVSFVLVLAASALKLVGPILTKIVIDDYIAVGNLSGLNTIAAIYVLALVLQFVVSIFPNLHHEHGRPRVLADMRAEIFSHLQKLQSSFFDRNPVGRLVTRVTTDVDALNELFTSASSLSSAISSCCSASWVFSSTSTSGSRS